MWPWRSEAAGGARRGGSPGIPPPIAPPTASTLHPEFRIYHNRRFNPSGGGAGGKNHFLGLGRVRIYGSQFSRRGEEGIVYFPLEKGSLLSWIRGEVGLKIYYYDEPAMPPPPEDRPSEGAENGRLPHSLAGRALCILLAAL